MNNSEKFEKNEAIRDLCEVVKFLDNPDEVFLFLKDICTPLELDSLAERWQICKFLDSGLSYREINKKLGASLTTIGRVARFLNNEPYHGYRIALEKLKNKI